MRLTAEHFIEFVVDEDTSIELPVVTNPSYIYVEGDIIISYPMKLSSDTQEDKPVKFEVIDIENELYDVGIGEQVTKVHLRKVK